MKSMTSKNGNGMPMMKHILTLGGIACLGALSACASHTPCDKPPVTAEAPSDKKQEIFVSPEAAVAALVDATRDNNESRLLRIFGSDGEKLVSSGDKIADEEGRKRFLMAYDKAHSLETTEDGRVVLIVGEEEWPLPIPLMGSSEGWWFDTAYGKEEILNRRIGRNELNVVETCRAFVEAEHDFAHQSREAGLGYAFTPYFRSHHGKHDGLYWPTKAGEDESPLGSLFADAASEGYGDKALGNRTPYHGYYYRILTKQGPNAAGGARDYISDGLMTGGVALIAFPARYGDSGVMSFIVNQNGIVYEKNLGPDTIKAAGAITAFDPDSSWNFVQ